MRKHKSLNKEKTLERVVEKIKSYLVGFNEQKFIKAFNYADKAHQGQMRKDNVTPYIFHPIETAEILSRLHVDEDTLIAALLHDVPEDTSKTLSDVSKAFGKKIGFLIDGITKLSKVYYRHDMEARQIESLKKLLIHSAKDPRVILIKLADRLHNMSTLEFVRPAKRVRIAKETLEIYVPIANLLGIDEIKKELEDLCFKHLFPKEYQRIEESIAETKIRQADFVQRTTNTVKRLLIKENIKNVKITGREKSPYSIYKKTIRKNQSPDEIEDLLALRVIVDDTKDCYAVLGLIHSMFKPKPRRFKDYIAVPKPNGYQSLHTVVFGISGQVTEFQIRTEEMHIESKYGIAAHYFYRAKQDSKDVIQDKRSKWVEKILEYQKENHTNKDFLEALKIDIFQDRIFTFTPEGDTIDLPLGGSCIDFAYAIHTEVGNNAIKAIINGQISPLTTPLQTGDVIQIISAEKPKGPNREWLIFAKTNLAKNKIREALKHISRKKKISIGRRLLQKELDRAGIGLIEEIPKKKIRQLIVLFKSKLKVENFEDILTGLGEGSIGTLEVLKVVYPKKAFQKSGILNYLKKLFRIKSSDKRRIGLQIKAIERMGAGRDLLGILSEQNINVLKIRLKTTPLQEMFTMHLLIEIDSFDRLSYLCDKMELVEDIIDVRTRYQSKKFFFYLLAGFTLSLWIAHPFLLFYLDSIFAKALLHDFMIYAGFAMLFFLVYRLKKLTRRSFPEIRGTGYKTWFITFIIGNIALTTVIGEIYFYKLTFNWFIVLFLVLSMYAYLATDYFSNKKLSKIQETNPN